MRIGMICPYSLTLPGGVQGQVLSLSKALIERGIEVRVLGPCDGPPPDTSITPLGSSLPTTSNGSIAPIAPDPSAVLRTIRALRDERLDLLHIHEPLCPGPAVTALIVKPAPIVGTFHAAGTVPYYKYLDFILKPIANNLDIRCAVSPSAAKSVQEVLGGECEVLFNGIDLKQYQKVKSKPNERLTILFLGRHEQRKGLLTLIQAMAELPLDISLKIAGEGPETRDLTSLTVEDPRIEWLGKLSTEEKNTQLAKADVFCVPSVSGESFGVVLLEAMASKTPIVASNIEGYAAVARKDLDAVLVPPENPHALAKGILKVLEDKSFQKKLVASGAKRAEEYSMDKLADAYEKIYIRCLEQQNTSVPV